MGTRTIPILGRSVGSKVAVPGQSALVHTESSLETDFAVLMAFDPTVKHIESQPVTIQYRDAASRERRYTPDFLTHFQPDADFVQRRVPELVEIKYTADLEKQQTVNGAKFEAARDYARWRRWTFRVVTEQDIRTPYLDNAKFLLPYIRDPRWDEARAQHILDTLQRPGATSVRGLLALLTEDTDGQARLLPRVWQLVAYRYIDADLTTRLTMRTELRWKPPAPYPLKAEWIHDRRS